MPLFHPRPKPDGFRDLSILEADSCATSYSSTAVLRQALETTWSNMSEGAVRRSCVSVMRRMEAAVEANVGHIDG